MSNLSKKQYAKILKNLVDDAGEIEVVSDLFFEFVQKTTSLAAMHGILEEYKKLNERKKVSVTSKTKLDNEIKKEIESAFGENIEIIEQVDPEMIGGIKIQTETHIFDASVTNQLQSLKQKLNS